MVLQEAVSMGLLSPPPGLLLSAPWWMKLSFVPRVAELCEQLLSLGSCVLKKTLSSLSANGWGYDTSPVDCLY